jgi:hypothetical protein
MITNHRFCCLSPQIWIGTDKRINRRAEDHPRRFSPAAYQEVSFRGRP